MATLRRCIAILEDNAERRVAMANAIRMHFADYECQFFLASQEMIVWLPEHLAALAAISLDHDLEPEENSGPWRDPGDGRHVADFLAAQRSCCRVIIHSTNVPAAIGMEEALTSAGWSVERITPYDDLTWIEEAWLPAIEWAFAAVHPK